MGNLDMIDLAFMDPGPDDDAVLVAPDIIGSSHIQKRVRKCRPFKAVWDNVPRAIVPRAIGQCQATAFFGLLGGSSEFNHRSSVS